MSENHPLPKHVVMIKKLRSLLAIVENAVKDGDNYTFRNLYADEDGKEIDILEDGRNSCGVFVSWILLVLELIKHPHATVHGTEKDMLESGWFEVSELKAGAIIVWEKREAVQGLLGNKDMEFAHIGFYVGNNEAISNDSKGTGFPWAHHVTYDGTRQVEKIYWHSELGNG